MDAKKTIIDTLDEHGEKLKLFIAPFGYKILQDAQMEYNIKLTSLIRKSASTDNKLLTKYQLDQHLNDLGIWTEKEIKQFLQLQLELRSLEFKLQSGGLTIPEGKKIAFEIKSKRLLLVNLYNRRLQFDSITMESTAENQKFKFIVVACTKFAETNKPFFASISDYEARQNEKAAIDAATCLAGKLHF